MDYLITSSEGEEYISHHGVLGMKWGIRHGRKKTGRRSNMGGSDSSGNKLTDEQKKKILMGVGITAAAVGTILIGSSVAKDLSIIGRLNSKELIKAGTTIQNVSASKLDTGKQFYASMTTRDKLAYKGFLPSWLRSSGPLGRGQKATINSVVAQRDIKIANKSTGESIYKEILNRHPESSWGGTSYKKFNGFLVEKEGATPEFDKIRSEFYQTLKERGYSGLSDLNDKKANPLLGGTQTPTIFFDGSGLGNEKVRKMGYTEEIGSSVVNYLLSSVSL